MYSTSDRAQGIKQCLTCGADFTPSPFRPGQKFCSDSCRYKHVDLVGSPHEYTCEQCGKVYRAKRKDRSRFCSRECCYAYEKEHGRPSRRKHRSFKPLPSCAVCGTQCSKPNHKFCSQDCRDEQRRRADRARRALLAVDVAHATYVCKTCGREFDYQYGTRRKSYCSAECAKKSAKKSYRSAGNFNSFARKRLRRLHGEEWRSYYEPIIKRQVFNIYGNNCYMCGRKLAFNRVYSPLQATIDHVLPLALGGEHTYDNVRPCCMECNSKKGATF